MGFSTKEQMQKFLTRWPSPNTMLCGAANESKDSGAPQNAERKPPVETKPKLAASAEANVRQNIKIGARYKFKEQPNPFFDYDSTIAIPLQVKNGYVQFHFLNKIKKWSMEVEVFLRIYELA